jgi:predicted porin
MRIKEIQSMNRKLLALAIGAAFALPMAAQAAPTVYGLLNLSVDMVNIESSDDPTTPAVNEGVDNIQVTSNASRIGVRGDENLGSGLAAVYQVEWLVNGDGTSVGELSTRNRFLGLKSSFGTFKLGSYDSPLREAQGALDQFDDMFYGDMGNYLDGEIRLANVIGYESPKFADAITIKLALQPGESNANDGIAEAMSAAVAYEANGLYVAAAVDKDVNNTGVPFTGANMFSATPGDGRDTMRLVGTYTMDALVVGAMLQSSESSDEGPAAAAKRDQEALVLSAAYTMGKNVIKGQLATVEDETGPGADVETMFIGVGFDHNFTQMTKAFAQVLLQEVDNSTPLATPNGDDSVFSIGMQTKF